MQNENENNGSKAIGALQIIVCLIALGYGCYVLFTI